MKKSAIIVAGGFGSRMKSDIPKQFLKINGIPILIHTIKKFCSYDKNLDLIVVLPKSHIQQWEAIKRNYLPKTTILEVFGGTTRGASVLAGLMHIKEGFVAIHDAVRPFVSIKTIADSFESAQKNGSGIAVVPLKDSIRKIKKQVSFAKRRSDYVLVQTPQTFEVKKIKEAYKTTEVDLYTDDASIFEAIGNAIHLVDGTYENIKITTPEDIKT